MNFQLNFKKKGAGKPILILHGLFGMLDNWNTVGSILAKDYCVYLIDQRDHGRSPKSNKFNYKILAEDIKNFCDDEGIEKVTIIGHSMGGKTAMSVSKLYPDLVDRLIVVDIAPKRYEGNHHSIFEAIFAVPINQVKSRAEVEEVLSQYINDQGVRLFLMKNLSRNPEGGYTWKANFELLRDRYDDIMEAITFEEDVLIPTLFIRGALSKYILDSDFIDIQAIFTKCELVDINDAGHWVHAQKPKELIEAIHQFLKDF